MAATERTNSETLGRPRLPKWATGQLFLSVDNDGCDLLIKEDEDGGEDSGDQAERDQPPVSAVTRVNHPCTVITGSLQEKIM